MIASELGTATPSVDRCEDQSTPHASDSSRETSGHYTWTLAVKRGMGSGFVREAFDTQQRDVVAIARQRLLRTC
jgi:hypothetical protein